MSEEYTYKDYDRYLCLKPGSDLVLAILFLLRPYILLVSSLRMGRGGSGVTGVGGLKDLVYPNNLSLTIGILATAPVILFLIAWVKRKPGASAFIQQIWHKGATILTMAALLSVLAVLFPVMTGAMHAIHPVGWVQLALSVLIMLYLQLARRVKDTFADFPEESAEERETKGRKA